MILETVAFGILTASLVGYTIYDNKKLDRNAKKNEDKIREGVLAEIDKAGLSVSDFPKHEDALNGERHLKVPEVIDIYYVCRTRRRR